MPFTANELANIANSALDYYLNKGKTEKQNIQDKPMLQAFEASAGEFPGGKGLVSIGVKGGQGGGSFQGYTHDDQVTYYNPASNLRVGYPWKEHHIGLGITHTELKIDGITVVEDGADQETREKDGREQFAIANLLDSKLEDFDEDKKKSWDALIHGDGTADAKALAGIQSIILDNPAVGSTGGLSRVTYPWWRNRAATAAAAAADSGFDAIASSAAGGGVLAQFLQKESRQIRRFAQGGVKHRWFAGSDFIDAYEREVRANGNYTLNGFRGNNVDAAMDDAKFGGSPFIYDPTMDDMGLAKRCYVLDLRRIRLMYMIGEKNKKASPPRPYDRYVMYRGLTSTAVMVASQLNTSAVYDIK
ncbi:phage major capsid protein [Methylobacterium sp.]|uniref:phage major capsid protein n=1 Tax=Methylobacterium sp. TaxID=409 RepID=UPI000FAAF162|nr:phage major capsid protein [Methylobacterium sp.]RUP22308.1 MAG: phage major capsid protein [Methylobacterium sp.]